MLPAESHPSRGVLGAEKKIGSNPPPKILRGELGGHSRTCPVLPRDKSPLDKVHPYPNRTINSGESFSLKTKGLVGESFSLKTKGFYGLLTTRRGRGLPVGLTQSPRRGEKE